MKAPAADPPGSDSLPEKGWDRRRRRVSEHIENTALEIFGDRGFREVTVDDIATAAGVSSRTVARYFPLKEDFLLALPRRLRTMAVAQIGELEVGPRPVADLWAMWTAMSDLHESAQEQLLVWRRAVESAPEVVARSTGEGRMVLNRVLAVVFADAMGLDPRSDVRVGVVAAALEAATTAVLEFWILRDGQDDLAELYRQSYQALRDQFGAV